MAKKEESKELVGNVNTILEEMPDYLKGMEDDISGSEDVGKDDIVIPRLAVIQAISPEVDESDPAYIPGAKAGMMFNTLTRTLLTELLVIPVKFEKPFLAWRDRKKGGGFGGQYDTMEQAEDAVSAMDSPTEWDIIDTPTNLCIAIPPEGRPYEISIPLPKSKAKVSRNWNSMIRLAGGPRFSRVYKITTVDDKNQAGDKYKNFRVEMVGFPSKELFEKAKEIYDLIMAGEVKYKADYSDEQANPESGGKENPAF